MAVCLAYVNLYWTQKWLRIRSCEWKIARARGKLGCRRKAGQPEVWLLESWFVTLLDTDGQQYSVVQQC